MIFASRFFFILFCKVCKNNIEVYTGNRSTEENNNSTLRTSNKSKSKYKSIIFILQSTFWALSSRPCNNWHILLWSS